MADIKLTKNELKHQKTMLDQLQKYLPTLQLKKSLLQAEVLNARQEKNLLDERRKKDMADLTDASPLLGIDMPFPIEEAVSIQNVDVEQENIAGAELPKLKSVTFRPFEYSLYATPVWIDAVLMLVKRNVETKIKLNYASERLHILERELKEVSVRVNLFEKVLIPRCKENIKKIKIFLGDLQLAQVSQAKVAKAKIIERKEEHERMLEQPSSV